jgi:hypothetical protein
VILSGLEIQKRLGSDIIIDPYNPDQLNPNSYNLRLHQDLLVYDEPVLDMKKPNAASPLTIPEEGLLLESNRLYLGRTVEHTRTENLVPMLEGRSSIGRLGFLFTSPRDSATWASTVSGPLRSSASSRFGYTPAWRYARFSTTVLKGNTHAIPAASTRITGVFRRPCCTRISRNKPGVLFQFYSGQHSCTCLYSYCGR